ncbi:MAG: DUF2637 domain-containing protein [Actinomycetota bacterium]|nr:DUF2637 domain-containing protein [Actinomycetota bacterium]
MNAQASVRARGGRVAVATAVAGTVFIAAGAFWLSFTALADLARRSGIDAGQAWAWPLIVDGIIVVSTVAVVALARQRSAWYPWVLLAAGALVSVTANAIHAVVAADADVPGVLAASVAAVPPLVLLAITHLTVILTRPAANDGTVPPSDEEETAPEGGLPDLHAFTPEQVPVRELAARLRDAEGWSNKAIARHLGVHPSTVGRWFARPELTGTAESDEETP